MAALLALAILDGLGYMPAQWLESPLLRAYVPCGILLITALLAADVTVTDRRYIGHEDDTGYHHYAIDVAKSYVWEE